MSLFQRIKTPFSDSAEAESDQPERRAHAVGALLRARRDELGLDIAAIGEALCIKPIFLTALEQGRTHDLPGPTYAIGFVRAYAHYLGFDTERVLEVYKAEAADVHARPDLSLPVPLGARSLPGGPILLVGLILALCGYGTWYYLATGERNRPERVAAVPAELQQLAPLAGPRPADTTLGPANAGSAASGAAPRLASGLTSPDTAVGQPAAPPPGIVATPAVAALPATAVSPPPNQPASDAAPGQLPTAVVAAATPTGDPGKAVGNSAAKPAGDPAAKPTGQVEIKAVADCWIQVRGADQSVVFSRVLKAGESYQVPRPGLILRTGNAGALAIVVDGKATPAIGAVGTLRRNVTLEPEALLAGTAVKG